MEMQTFGLLLAQLSQLTARQCALVQAQLRLGDARRQVGRLLDEAAQPQLCCPCSHAVHW